MKNIYIFFLITFILATERKGPQSTIHMNEDLTTSGNVIYQEYIVFKYGQCELFKQ